jgi:threonyl-tRNA synthetase
MIVVGDREIKENSIALRKRGQKKIENLKLNSFIKRVKSEIDKKI